MAVNAGDLGPGSGTSIWIADPADPLPTSPDPWTRVGRVETAGAFGRSFSTFTFADLDTREEELFKGLETAVTWELGLGHQLTDDGQAALQTAVDSDLDHWFRVILNDSSDGVELHGTWYVFQGKALGFTVGPFNNNAVVKATVRVGITAGTTTRTDAT